MLTGVQDVMLPEPSKAGSTLHTRIRRQEFFKLCNHLIPFLYNSFSVYCHQHAHVLLARDWRIRVALRNISCKSLWHHNKRKKKCLSVVVKVLKTQTSGTLSVFTNVVVLSLSTAGKWHNDICWKKPEDRENTGFFVIKDYRIAVNKGISPCRGYLGF